MMNIFLGKAVIFPVLSGSLRTSGRLNAIWLRVVYALTTLLTGRITRERSVHTLRYTQSGRYRETQLYEYLRFFAI